MVGLQREQFTLGWVVRRFGLFFSVVCITLVAMWWGFLALVYLSLFLVFWGLRWFLSSGISSSVGVVSRNGQFILSGLMWGIRSSLAVWFFNERLVPDTAEFSAGHACWSSPVACASGFVAGHAGVSVVSCLGSFALGFLLLACGGSWFRALLVWVSPVGWYSISDGMDASGSAGVVYVVHKGWKSSWAFCFLALLHLQSALVYGFVVVCRRFGISARVDYLAIGAGLISMLGEWHVQIRYLLPGLALWAAYQGDSVRTKPWEKKCSVVVG